MGEIICFIIPTFKRGGMERVMSELANYSTNMGYKVNVVFLIDHTPEYEINSDIKLIFPNIDYGSKSRGLFYWMKILLYLRRTIKSIRPNTILSIPQGYSTFTIFSLSGIDVPIYISDRNSPNKKLGLLRRIARKIYYPKAAGIIAQTSYAKKSLLDKGIKNHNIRVIPNPLKAIHNYPKPYSEKKIILNIGRLVPEKNQQELIDIFSEMNPLGWKLHIIGSGPLKQELRERIEQNNMEHKIFIFDAVPDVDIEMAKAEIFAFTSIYEGFPNSLNEAMAFPLACISYDCIAGPSEIIEDGKNGYLVEMGNKLIYIERLRHLMNDENIRMKFMKEAVLNREKYSADKISELYLEFILDHN